MSDLAGATTPADENAYPSTAGEFAARWNSWPEARRQEWLDSRVRESQAINSARAAWGRIDRLGNRIEDRVDLDRALAYETQSDGAKS